MAWNAFLGVTLALIAAPIARAAEPDDDACQRARETLGTIAPDMSPAACQQALDSAEEERWQLWLDLAAADEGSGDREKAALSLYRFVTAADRRGTRLPAEWVVVRDQARTNAARLDGEILKTKGRVTITASPEPVEATLDAEASAKLPERNPTTPVTAYFAPGTHRVSLYHRPSGAAREVSFNVVAGGVVALQVDLRPGVPAERSVVETPGEPVLGQRPATELVAPPPDTVGPEPMQPSDAELPQDREGPPIRRLGPSPLTTIGTASIAAGVAALAVGTVFSVVAAGLDDEAACRGAACDVDAVLRREVRRDAQVDWDRATGTFITGGLLVAGGIVAILLDDDDAQKTAVTPWLGPEGAGLAGSVRF